MKWKCSGHGGQTMVLVHNESSLTHKTKTMAALLIGTTNQLPFTPVKKQSNWIVPPKSDFFHAL